MNWFRESNRSFINSVKHMFIAIWCALAGLIHLLKGEKK